MKINLFELRLAQRRLNAGDGPLAYEGEAPYCFPEVWIDGQFLDEPHPVCVSSVLMSMERPHRRGKHPQWHDVFTCGCGTAACANIDEGVGSVHAEHTVDWVLRRPQANVLGPDPIGYRAWCETAEWHHYRFNREQATRELIRFLDEVWLQVQTGKERGYFESQARNWFEHDPRHHMRYRGADLDHALCTRRGSR